MKDENFIKVYLSLFEHTDLSIYDITIFSLIKSFSINKGYCWAKVDTISKLLNIGEKTVRRSINKLIEKKYVLKWTHNHGKIRYRVFVPTDMIDSETNLKDLMEKSEVDIKNDKFYYNWLDED